jgi:hypothetical protein
VAAISSRRLLPQFALQRAADRRIGQPQRLGRDDTHARTNTSSDLPTRNTRAVRTMDDNNMVRSRVF